MEDGPSIAQIIDARTSYPVAALINEPSTDSTDSTARDWLRRWGASGIQPKPPTCACVTGRCRICN